MLTRYVAMACFKLGVVIEGTWSRYLIGQASREAGERLHAKAQNLIDLGTRVAKGDNPFDLSWISRAELGPRAAGRKIPHSSACWGTFCVFSRGLPVGVDAEFDGQGQSRGADRPASSAAAGARRTTMGTQARSHETTKARVVSPQTTAPVPETQTRRPQPLFATPSDDVLARVGMGQCRARPRAITSRATEPPRPHRNSRHRCRLPKIPADSSKSVRPYGLRWLAHCPLPCGRGGGGRGMAIDANASRRGTIFSKPSAGVDNQQDGADHPTHRGDWARMRFEPWGPWPSKFRAGTQHRPDAVEHQGDRVRHVGGHGRQAH